VTVLHRPLARPAGPGPLGRWGARPV